MDNSALAEALHARLDAKTRARDQGLQSSRSAVRSCGNAIRALHRHELDNASALIAEAHAHLEDAETGLSEHPEILYAGFVHDAQKELAEALITFALVTGRGLPAVDEVGVMPSAYLKGMAESVGELRRHLLDLMRQGQLARCEELLGAMDDIYYPAGVDGLSGRDHDGTAAADRRGPLNHRAHPRRLHDLVDSGGAEGVARGVRGAGRSQRLTLVGTGVDVRRSTVGYRIWWLRCDRLPFEPPALECGGRASSSVGRAHPSHG